MLKRKWLEGEQLSNRLTPFSSFEFYCAWEKAYRFKGSRRSFKPVYFLCEDQQGFCIFPMAVDSKHKIIRDLSQCGPVDYFDVICSNIDNSFIHSCLKAFLSGYRGYSLSLANINETSVLYNVLRNFVTPQESCVKIVFESPQYENYYERLSKHQRQNLRTGYNKLEREGIGFRLEKYTHLNNPISLHVWHECISMYQERRRAVGKVNFYLLSKIAEWKHRMINPINRLLPKSNSAAIFVLFFKDTPVANMAGFYNKDKSTFYVPRLTTCTKYLKYDAGIIMLNESIKLMIWEGVTILDLTRGDEPYKYAMGGVEHINYGFATPVDKFLVV